MIVRSVLFLLNNFSLVQKQIDTIKKERIRLLEELAKIKSINTYPSDSNFILFQTTENGEMVFRNLMEKQKIQKCQYLRHYYHKLPK